MQTYNQIIQRFEQFAKAHYVLQTYGTGEPWQIVEHNKLKNRKYPIMWVEDRPFSFSDKVTTYNFRVYFLAQVATLKNQTEETLEQTNVCEVKSDMLQCANDLLSFWVQDTDFNKLDIDRNTSAESFNEHLQDNLAGWYIDIKIQQAFDYNICEIPIDGVPLPPSGSCPNATYRNSDNSFTQEIQSGSSYSAPDVTITINGTPNNIPSNIDYNFNIPLGATNIKLLTGQETKYADFDDGDNFINGLYNNSLLDDFLTLSSVNEWGHNKRFTGDTGGYMDELTGLFYNADGTTTTKAGAFPNDILRDYYTRLRWFLNRSGSLNWNTIINFTATATRGGETGWRTPNIMEYFSISNYGNSSPTYIDSRLFNWSAFTLWSSTTHKGNISQAHRFNSSSADTSITNKTQANASAFVKNF